MPSAQSAAVKHGATHSPAVGGSPPQRPSNRLASPQIAAAPKRPHAARVVHEVVQTPQAHSSPPRQSAAVLHACSQLVLPSVLA